MHVHWDTIVWFHGRPWVIVTVPIHELPKHLQEAVIQIEDDLSMELTLPAFLKDGAFQPLWPNGDKSVPKMMDLLRETNGR